jgi:hypothetical protein
MLLVVFLMIAILTGVKWNLSVVLICIFFMARDGEHFFMYFFLPLGFLPFKKFSCPFLYWVTDLGEFSFLSSLHILVVSPLIDV